MVDAAFKGAGKAVGLELWRIEKLSPVKQAHVSNHSNAVSIMYVIFLNTSYSAGQWQVPCW